MFWSEWINEWMNWSSSETYILVKIRIVSALDVWCWLIWPTSHPTNWPTIPPTNRLNYIYPTINTQLFCNTTPCCSAVSQLMQTGYISGPLSTGPVKHLCPPQIESTKGSVTSGKSLFFNKKVYPGLFWILPPGVTAGRNLREAHTPLTEFEPTL